MKKKLMVLVAALAMMVALASPAFAEAIGGDVSVEFLSAPQFQFAAALQTQQGDATSSASGVATAADAAISQGLDISQMQLNGGF